MSQKENILHVAKKHRPICFLIRRGQISQCDENVSRDDLTTMNSTLHVFIPKHLRAKRVRRAICSSAEIVFQSSPHYVQNDVSIIYFSFFVIWEFRVATRRVEWWNFVDIDCQLHRGKYRDSCSRRVEWKAIRDIFNVINIRSQIQKYEYYLKEENLLVQPRLSKLTSFFNCMANSNQIKLIKYPSLVCLLRSNVKSKLTNRREIGYRKEFIKHLFACLCNTLCCNIREILPRRIKLSFFDVSYFCEIR